MPPIIGIDLGTTNSLCAIFEDKAPRLIPNSVGELLTPSVVGLTESGDVLVVRRTGIASHAAGALAACFKRFMGSGESLTLAGQKFTPVELSSLVLKSLREDAKALFEGEVTDAVITVPAYFNDNQRQATKQAGELAGLKVRRIVNEPTAAALTYGFHDRDAEKKILVIDLGGGTFDVTLMDVFEGTLEIVSTAGESFLGGEDFTDRLMASLLQKQGLQLETAELQEPHRVARLRRQSEVAKQELTASESVKVKMPDAGPHRRRCITINISRKAYTKLVEPLVERLKPPVAKALRDGRADTHDIEDVILVSSATRMPVVHDFVRSFFKKEPLCKFNPDEVVALGGTVPTALIGDDQAVDDLVMTDVCPFTLGIDTVKEFGPEYKPGYFTPIIHRNTTIPVSREEMFSTVAANRARSRSSFTRASTAGWRRISKSAS